MKTYIPTAQHILEDATELMRFEHCNEHYVLLEVKFAHSAHRYLHVCFEQIDGEHDGQLTEVGYVSMRATSDTILDAVEDIYRLHDGEQAYHLHINTRILDHYAL